MAFTRNELNEYFTNVPNAQTLLPMVLEQMKFDSSTEEFPDDIVERVEEMFEKMNVVIDTKRKQLTGTAPKGERTQEEVSTSNAITLQESAPLVADVLETYDISLSNKQLTLLTASLMGQSIDYANAVYDVVENAFDKTLQQRTNQLNNKLLASVSKSKNQVSEFFTPENISKLISAHVPDEAPIDTEAIIQEMKLDRQRKLEGKQQKVATLAAKREEKKAKDMSVDDILAEIYG